MWSPSRGALKAFAIVGGGALAVASWVKPRPIRCEGGTHPQQSRLHTFGLTPRKLLGQEVGGPVGSSKPCPTSMAIGGSVVAASYPDGSMSAASLPPGGEAACEIQLRPRLSGRVASVAADGRGSIFLVTQCGRVQELEKRAAAGWNEAKYVENLEGVRQVCCGASHCIAVDADGRAHSWATGPAGGDKGALGRTIVGDKRQPGGRTPAPVDLPEGSGRIVAAACGDAHSMMVDQDGRLWAFGSDRWLQLGLGDSWEKGQAHRMLPTEVTALKGRRVAKVACGGDHTVAMMADGEVLVWGRGKEGQLGSGKKVFASAGITRLSGTPSLPALTPLGVAAAGHCSLVVMSDRGYESLWWVGRCPAPLEGQLPDGETCDGAGGASLLLAMGGAVASGNPKGGDSLKKAAAVGVVRVGTHLGEGCASCRAKRSVEEMMARASKGG